MSTAADRPEAPRFAVLGSYLRNRGLREGLFVITLAAVVLGGTLAFLVLRTLGEAPGIADRAAVDGLLGLLAVLSLIAIVLGHRRIQDLNKEIRARRKAETIVAALARQDALTGLPNREDLAERLCAMMESDRAERFALLRVDLARFKPTNELYGQRVGDQILTECAERLLAVLGPQYGLARFGEDDFAVLQPKIDSLDDPARLARRIVVALEEPFLIAGRSIKLGAKIGIAIAPDDAERSDDLVRRAALALGHAKKEKGSSVRFFSPDMDADQERRARIEQEFRVAVASSSFRLQYQPVVGSDDGRARGFEALARWRSPLLGDVPPTLFISIAEECGLMREPSDQMLRSACADAVRWPDGLKLTFNLSESELFDPALGLRVLGVLGQTGLAPGRLELDVNESALGGDLSVARRVFGELRAAGVGIALDGFGSGLASVSQLLALRFDKIKIAREIVQQLDRNPESVVVAKGIVSLATGLGLRTAAVGVETAAQLEQLRIVGCPEWQGFLCAKPMPAAEIHAFLRRGARTQKAESAAAKA